MPCYAFEGLRPVVDPTAFVHPMASLIGDVHVGAGCFVGPGASLRGDFGRIELQAGSNVQDNCVLHAAPGWAVLIEAEGHVGHGAVLHGCVIRPRALVGINAIIMDGAEIGEESIVAAAAFVREGFVAPPRVLLLGVPARVVRNLDPVAIQRKAQGTRLYQVLAERCAAALRECTALETVEPGRPVRDSDLIEPHRRD